MPKYRVASLHSLSVIKDNIWFNLRQESRYHYLAGGRKTLQDNVYVLKNERFDGVLPLENQQL